MKKIKIAIQGYKGSYSHQAVENIAKKNNLNFEIIENDSFTDSFKSIKKYGLGLIPVENSTAGFVEKTIDELVLGDFEIIGEFHLKVNHSLLGLKKAKLSDIKKVYSHYQALAQTSNFLEKNKIKPIDSGDTAGGAKFISTQGKIENGAIGSEILSKIYDLKILKKNINNQDDNVTRFFLIKRKGYNPIRIKYNQKNKIALVFKTKNIPGALYKALGGFATNGVDLTKIISRPIKDKKFGYLFYLEFYERKNKKNIEQALKELNFFSEKVILLGNFKEI